ncbi:MAG: indolepyruvate oxidoreductase subunit beta [Eggerthellaceae bacterium]|jgi:indolepyruvate ferredoxin oxidoreductase beta subunit|nr:indolepyruvate oxidoreductase subunit beta [Eggerthellaceae bacterium]
MNENGNVTTVLLCGVGGQGTILAADLLAQVALASGCDVKVSEIHGMAQRGGAVTTVVRFGDAVRSMVCDEGCADYVVAFELIEALRNLPFKAAGGTLIASDEVIEPMAVAAGKAALPPGLRQTLEAAGAFLVPADALAREAGNAKASNVALLGALSAFLGFPMEAWQQAIEGRVPPRTVEVNLKALEAGRSVIAAAEGR